MTDLSSAGPVGLTPEALTNTLTATNPAAGRVTALKALRIGQDRAFSGGAVWRLWPTCDGGADEDALPPTLIAKCPPADLSMRAALAPANRREAAFYRRFAAPGLPVPRPFGQVADTDGAAASGTLILQDLGHLSALRLVDGCDADRARDAVRALAAVHARWWLSPELAGVQGASLHAEFPFADLWPRFVAMAAPEPALRALGDRMARSGPAFLDPVIRSAPATLLHGDPHVENMLFGDAGFGQRAALLDWQMAGQGPGAWDLGYFLASSLSVPLRRQVEEGLIADYLAALADAGIAAPRRDRLRDMLAWSAAAKLFMTVVATTLMDNAGPAKAAYRRADLDRLSAFCADHPSHARA